MEKKVAIFVQARMRSTRLPGKVLKPILNRPLLDYLIERLSQVQRASELVILTSIKKEDDVIASFCQERHVLCYRGSEEDVLSRYYQAALERKPEAIVRITADCPLIDPEIVDQVIQNYVEAFPLYDYVSNSLKRTFPRGLDAEIFSFQALDQAFHEAKNQAEREHVTLYFYQHPELFRLKNIASPVNLSSHRWTVDTPEDFHLIQLIIENLYPSCPNFRLKDILELLDKHPEWSKINAHIEQKSI